MVVVRPLIATVGYTKQRPGYIGSHVVLQLLLSKRYNVAVIDNSANSHPESIKRVESIAAEETGEDQKVRLFQGDLKKKADVENIFSYFEQNEDKKGITGVIHIAALKAVGESAEKPLDYYLNNIAASIQLLEVMREHNCYNFVYSSSATVYGEPPKVPIPETSPLQSESPYSRTKVFFEQMLKDIANSQPDKWRIISLRYFNPAGAHPSGKIGEDPLGKPNNLLPLLAQISVGRSYGQLKVFGNDYPTYDGTCVRDYIHVMDLAAGHMNALDALDRDEIFHDVGPGKAKAYNLGTGQGQSVLTMIESMREASGFDYQYQIVERRAGDVPNLTADPALAQKELGFKTVRDLKQMCQDTVRWQKGNPNGYRN